MRARVRPSVFEAPTFGLKQPTPSHVIPNMVRLMLTPTTIVIALLCCAMLVAAAYLAVEEL